LERIRFTGKYKSPQRTPSNPVKRRMVRRPSAPSSRLLERITDMTTAFTVGFMPYNNMTTPAGEKISIQ